MTTQPEKVVFHGIDAWNRPCFRSLDRPARFFGATDKLFRDDASIDTVLSEVTAADLTYFGARFDCEPMGTAAVCVIVCAADPVDLDKTVEAITLARESESEAPFMTVQRPPLPTSIRIGGTPSGHACWVWCGLPALIDDYGTLLLINPATGETQS